MERTDLLRSSRTSDSDTCPNPKQVPDATPLDTGKPTCAGFFLYMPATGEILKWTVDEHGEWKKKQYGKVTWKNASDFDVERLP